MSAAARFKLAYLLLYGAIGILFNYYALYLQHAGLSGSQIGLVLGALALARVLSQPIWGLVGDLYRVRRLILSGSCFAAALTALALPHVPAFTGLLLVSIVLAIANGPIGPFCDALALEFLERDSHREAFGSLRLWGSVGFAFTSLAVGALVLGPALWLIVYLYSATMACMGLITASLPDTPEHVAPAERRISLGLWRNPTLLRLLLAVLLLGTTLGVANNFLIVYLDAIHAAGWVSGATFALAGLIEVPLMGAAGRLIERYGLRTILIGGVALQPIRWLLYLVIDQPLLVIPVQLFHSIAMLSLLIAGVLYVDRLLPAQWRASGQTTYSAMLHGIGPTIGVAGAGLIYEQSGLASLWWACTIINVLGVGLLIWAVRSPNHRPPDAQAIHINSREGI